MMKTSAPRRIGRMSTYITVGFLRSATATFNGIVRCNITGLKRALTRACARLRVTVMCRTFVHSLARPLVRLVNLAAAFLQPAESIRRNNARLRAGRRAFSRRGEKAARARASESTCAAVSLFTRIVRGLCRAHFYGR